MLSDRPLYAVLPASDIDRAEAFYRDVLGLVPTGHEMGNLVYRLAGGTFQIYPTGNAGTAKNTTMGWSTDTFDEDVESLRAAGVVFEDYDLPEFKTVNGVATFGNEKSAWFTDTEGNILCISHTEGETS